MGDPKHRYCRVAILSAVLLVLSGTLKSETERTALNVDDYVNAAMAAWEVPGLALAVVKGDQVILKKGYGVRDLRSRKAVDTRSLFAIASNSKAFTATALGLLVQEGRIGWDDPVLKHLPDFRLYDAEATRRVTVRDLLCHRCGLGLWAGDLTWWDSIYDRKEVIRRIRFQPPVKAFRTSYVYCNLMFLVAGEIIPAATGTSWDDFLARRFFMPLNMTRTNTSVRGLAGDGNVATPHSLVDGKLAPISYQNVDNCAPAAAVNSCVDDLIQWMRLQLDGGVYQGRCLVKPEIMEEIRKPHNLIQLSKQYRQRHPMVHLSAYALGFRLHDYRGRLVINHTGGLDGMLSYFGFMPEEKVGVIILTNSDQHGLYRALAYYLFDAALGVEGWDWSRRYLAVHKENLKKEAIRKRERQAERAADTQPSLPLSAYAGVFEDPVYGKARLVLSKDATNKKVMTLKLSAHPAITGTLTHWHHDTFQVRWDHRLWQTSFLQFQMDRQGRATGFTISVRPDWIDTRRYRFERIPEKGTRP